MFGEQDLSAIGDELNAVNPSAEDAFLCNRGHGDLMVAASKGGVTTANNAALINPAQSTENDISRAYMYLVDHYSNGNDLSDVPAEIILVKGDALRDEPLIGTVQFSDSRFSIAQSVESHGRYQVVHR